MTESTCLKERHCVAFWVSLRVVPASERPVFRADVSGIEIARVAMDSDS